MKKWTPWGYVKVTDKERELEIKEDLALFQLQESIRVAIETLGFEWTSEEITNEMNRLLGGNHGSDARN